MSAYTAILLDSRDKNGFFTTTILNGPPPSLRVPILNRSTHLVWEPGDYNDARLVDYDVLQFKRIAIDDGRHVVVYAKEPS